MDHNSIHIHLHKSLTKWRKARFWGDARGLPAVVWILCTVVWRLPACIRILCTVFHAMVGIWSANYITGRGRDWLTITNPVSTRMRGGGGGCSGWISWLGRGRFRWSRSRTIQDTMRIEKKGNNPATQEHGWLITDKLNLYLYIIFLI